MSKLNVGDSAPDFTATVVGGDFATGETVTLGGLKGQWVVLYFYPRDDTPGCTTQACGIRDGWQDLGGKAAIFGISVDGVASHEKFLAKYELPFPLLADESKEIVTAYGVWVEKSMAGRKYMGIQRTTFVIGPDGRIAALFEKVKPDSHVDLLLSVLPK